MNDDATPATDLAMLVAAAGLVDLEGADRSAYYGTLDDNPDMADKAVLFTDRGNDVAPVSDSDQFNKVTIIIRSERGGALWAANRAQRIANAIHGLRDQTLPDTGLWLVGAEAWWAGGIGLDEQGRPQEVVEARLYLMNPTPLRG